MLSIVNCAEALAEGGCMPTDTFVSSGMLTCSVMPLIFCTCLKRGPTTVQAISQASRLTVTCTCPKTSLLVVASSQTVRYFRTHKGPDILGPHMSSQRPLPLM